MPVLLYDADCGFCTQVARRLPRLRLKVEIATIQASDLATLRVSPERAEREIPFVGDDGQVTYGHRAMADALMTGPAPMRLAGRMLGSRLLGRLAERGYAWLAAHRHQLPGGTATCRLEDSPG